MEKARILFAFLGLLMFQGPSAHADWAPQELADFQWFAQFPVRLANAWMASLWGAVNTPELPGSSSVLDTVTVSAPDHFYRDIEAMTALQMDGDTVIRRPLVIVLPGTFTECEGRSPKKALRRLWANGFHAVAVGNPWSETWINAAPKATLGAVEFEADAVIETVRAVVDRSIGWDNVDWIEVYGESYGAFLASVLAARMPKDLASLWNGRITLMAPPVSMRKAMNRLDASIAESWDYYDHHCSSFGTKLKMLFGLMGSDPYAEPSQKIADCSESFVSILGFQDKAVEAARRWESVFQQGLIPTGSAESAWARDLNLEHFLIQFSPWAYENVLKTRKADLGYWVDKAISNFHNKAVFRILTAQNDPLNRDEDWDDNDYHTFRKSELIRLPYGGHMGYLSLPEFGNVFDSLY